MNDKAVLFRKVEMENGAVKSTTEIQGHVVDRVPELISRMILQQLHFII